jgi:hypothetical protein
MDKTLKVRELESGECLATFSCDGAACSCAFADERTIVAGRVHFLRLEEPKAKRQSQSGE